jgi:hypothetical protein
MLISPFAQYRKNNPYNYVTGEPYPEHRKKIIDDFLNPPPVLTPQDGYLSGGQFAENAKLDGRQLSTSETFDRLNPLNNSGYLNEQEYRNTYNPDGTLRNPEFNMMDYLNEVSTPALETVQKQQETHTMPDGTVMPGATHSEYEQMNKPALEDPFAEEDPYGNGLVPGQEGFKAPIKEGVGILASIADSLEENDGTGTATNNNRENTATAEELKAKKEARDRRNEMLIRVGGAIMGGASQGNLAAMSAGTREYGRLADYNRELAQKQKENELRQQEAERRRSTLNGGMTGQQQLDFDAFNRTTQASIAEFDDVIAALKAEGDSVTGLKDGTVGAFYDSKISKDPRDARRAVLRSRMKQITVDQTLLNTAKTKGAITEREMALFKGPMPSMTDTEEKWIAWLEKRKQALIETMPIIIDRMKNGIKVNYGSSNESFLSDEDQTIYEELIKNR